MDQVAANNFPVPDANTMMSLDDASILAHIELFLEQQIEQSQIAFLEFFRNGQIAELNRFKNQVLNQVKDFLTKRNLHDVQVEHTPSNDDATKSLASTSTETQRDAVSEPDVPSGGGDSSSEQKTHSLQVEELTEENQSDEQATLPSHSSISSEVPIDSTVKIDDSNNVDETLNSAEPSEPAADLVQANNDSEPNTSEVTLQCSSQCVPSSNAIESVEPNDMKDEDEHSNSSSEPGVSSDGESDMNRSEHESSSPKVSENENKADVPLSTNCSSPGDNGSIVDENNNQQQVEQISSEPQSVEQAAVLESTTRNHHEPITPPKASTKPKKERLQMTTEGVHCTKPKREPIRAPSPPPPPPPPKRPIKSRKSENNALPTRFSGDRKVETSSHFYSNQPDSNRSSRGIVQEKVTDARSIVESRKQKWSRRNNNREFSSDNGRLPSENDQDDDDGTLMVALSSNLKRTISMSEGLSEFSKRRASTGVHRFGGAHPSHTPAIIRDDHSVNLDRPENDLRNIIGVRRTSDASNDLRNKLTPARANRHEPVIANQFTRNIPDEVSLDLTPPNDLRNIHLLEVQRAPTEIPTVTVTHTQHLSSLKFPCRYGSCTFCTINPFERASHELTCPFKTSEVFP